MVAKADQELKEGQKNKKRRYYHEKKGFGFGFSGGCCEFFHA